MSQICFYLDEDAGKKSLANGLRNAGIDVITTAEADRLGSFDDSQLIWATEQRRVIYSFNVGDFCRLHKAYIEQQQKHSGIVLAAKQRNASLRFYKHCAEAEYVRVACRRQSTKHNKTPASHRIIALALVADTC